MPGGPSRGKKDITRLSRTGNRPSRGRSPSPGGGTRSRSPGKDTRMFSSSGTGACRLTTGKRSGRSWPGGGRLTLGAGGGDRSPAPAAGRRADFPPGSHRPRDHRQQGSHARERLRRSPWRACRRRRIRGGGDPEGGAGGDRVGGGCAQGPPRGSRRKAGVRRSQPRRGTGGSGQSASGAVPSHSPRGDLGKHRKDIHQGIARGAAFPEQRGPEKSRESQQLDRIAARIAHALRGSRRRGAGDGDEPARGDRPSGVDRRSRRGGPHQHRARPPEGARVPRGGGPGGGGGG